MTAEDVEDLSPKMAVELVAARMTYDTIMFRRPIYEAARMTGFFSMVPHVKKGSLKKFTDLVTFSHEVEDQPKEKPKHSPEELKALMQKLNN